MTERTSWLAFCKVESVERAGTPQLRGTDDSHPMLKCIVSMRGRISRSGQNLRARDRWRSLFDNVRDQREATGYWLARLLSRICVAEQTKQRTIHKGIVTALKEIVCLGEIKK